MLGVLPLGIRSEVSYPVKALRMTRYFTQGYSLLGGKKTKPNQKNNSKTKWLTASLLSGLVPASQLSGW